MGSRQVQPSPEVSGPSCLSTYHSHFSCMLFLVWSLVRKPSVSLTSPALGLSVKRLEIFEDWGVSWDMGSTVMIARLVTIPAQWEWGQQEEAAGSGLSLFLPPRAFPPAGDRAWSLQCWSQNDPGVQRSVWLSQEHPCPPPAPICLWRSHPIPSLLIDLFPSHLNLDFQDRCLSELSMVFVYNKAFICVKTKITWAWLNKYYLVGPTSDLWNEILQR